MARQQSFGNHATGGAMLRTAGGGMLAALALMAALPAAAQQGSQGGQTLPQLDPVPMPPVAEPLDQIYSRNAIPPRIATARFGNCVADERPEKADELLRSDFTQSSYKRRMQLLVDNNVGCAAHKGPLRGSSLLFVGFMAEGLLRKDSTPLNVRLARAATQPAPTGYTPGDVMAFCLVRSLPDQTAALLATKVDSPEEKAAAEQILPFAQRCAPAGKTVEITPDGLRAVLATAAYRSVAGAAETTKS